MDILILLDGGFQNQGSLLGGSYNKDYMIIWYLRVYKGTPILGTSQIAQVRKISHL